MRRIRSVTVMYEDGNRQTWNGRGIFDLADTVIPPTDEERENVVQVNKSIRLLNQSLPETEHLPEVPKPKDRPCKYVMITLVPSGAAP